MDPRASVLAVDLDTTTIGAVVHFPHERFAGAQWLAAVLLDPRHRGIGHGNTILRAAINHAANFSGRPYVAWAAHPNNQPANTLSRRICSPHNLALAVGPRLVDYGLTK